MNKRDLIAAVADSADLTRAKAGDAVDAVLAAIAAALKGKNAVRLMGFGTFIAADRKASTGRNPRTGEAMRISASTTVRFRVGRAVHRQIGGATPQPNPAAETGSIEDQATRLEAYFKAAVAESVRHAHAAGVPVPVLGQEAPVAWLHPDGIVRSSRSRPHPDKAANTRRLRSSVKV